MKLSEARKTFDNCDVGVAVFTAERGLSGPRVNVYPFKTSSKFLWLIWSGERMDFDDVSASIAAGGVTEDEFEQAVLIAVGELLAFPAGRALLTEKE